MKSAVLASGGWEIQPSDVRYSSQHFPNIF
jgi:hypothetical protein